MEMPTKDIVKEGYLKFKGKTGIWQRRWMLLKKASSKGGRRLERYNDERASKNSTGGGGGTTIDLSNVESLQRLPDDIKKHTFAICFKDSSSRSFSCESETEVAAWIDALTNLCLKEVKNNVTSIDLLQSGPSQKEYTELFHAYLMPSLNLAFYGECLLQVTQEHIHLLDVSEPSKRLVSWPLNALRRYGSDDSKFTFESGRFCDTGEGLFILSSKDTESIHRKVHAANLAIADMHRLMHKNAVARVQSVPGLGTPSHPTSPNRSHSQPAPDTHGPELPPRPQGMPGPPGSRGRTPGSALNSPMPGPPGSRGRTPGSALNSPLPPLPGQFEFGAEVYDDVGLPPYERAPDPPILANMAGPLGYLPMTGHKEDKDYVTLKGGSANTDGASSHPAPPPDGEQRSCHPAPPPDGDQRRPSTADVEAEYVYEEKGLTPAFRSYLKERKDV